MMVITLLLLGLLTCAHAPLTFATCQLRHIYDCILKQIWVVCLSLCPLHMASQLACCYADAVEGVFVFLGIGNSTLQTTEKLHTPRFKMDDSMMPVGAALHASMALQYLRTSRPVAKTATRSYQAQGRSNEL